MLIDTALPPAQEAPASGQQTNADQLATQAANEGAVDNASEAKEGEGEQKPKPEKTDAERERDRLRKAIDRRTRREAEAKAEAAGAKAEAAQLRAEVERLRATGSRQGDLRDGESRTTVAQDDEPLTLSRAELEKLVKGEAQRLAPTLTQQQAEIEHRTKVVEGLAKSLGQERFDELASDLDEALGGLQRDGKATPATEAIFAADDPQAVIKYLADPDNADEAEAIGRMDPVRAGRAIARLENKLEQSKAATKPQRSNAPEPVEPGKGGGAINSMPDPSNVKAWMKWANEEERRARNR